PGRPAGLGRPAVAVARPPAADGRAAARPSLAGPGRPLRYHPGGLHRSLRPAGRLRPPAPPAALPLAAAPPPPAAPARAPPAPPRREARHRPRGLALSRRLARGDLRRPGGATPGPRHPPQRGGHPRRAADPTPGGTQ